MILALNLIIKHYWKPKVQTRIHNIFFYHCKLHLYITWVIRKWIVQIASFMSSFSFLFPSFSAPFSKITPWTKIRENKTIAAEWGKWNKGINEGCDLYYSFPYYCQAMYNYINFSRYFFEHWLKVCCQIYIILSIQRGNIKISPDQN